MWICVCLFVCVCIGRTWLLCIYFFFYFINETTIYKTSYTNAHPRQMQTIHRGTIYTRPNVSKIWYFYLNALSILPLPVSFITQRKRDEEREWKRANHRLNCIHLLLHTLCWKYDSQPTLMHSRFYTLRERERRTYTHTSTNHTFMPENVRTDLHIRSSIGVSAMQWSRRTDASVLYTHILRSRQCMIFFSIPFHFKCGLEWLGIFKTPLLHSHLTYKCIYSMLS